MEDLLLIKEKICSTHSVFAIIAQKNNKLKAVESLYKSTQQKNSELIVSAERLHKELEDLQSFNAEYTAKYLEVKQCLDGLQAENEALKFNRDKFAKEYQDAKAVHQKTTKKLKSLELSIVEHEKCKKTQERMKEELRLCNEKYDALQLEKAVLEEQGVRSQLLYNNYQKCLTDLKEASDELKHCNEKLVSVETSRNFLETENLRLQTLLDKELKTDYISETCLNANCLSRVSGLEKEIKRLTTEIQNFQEKSGNIKSENEELIEKELLDYENIAKILLEMQDVPQMLEPIRDPVDNRDCTKYSENSLNRSTVRCSSKSIQTELLCKEMVSVGVETTKTIKEEFSSQTDVVQTSSVDLCCVSRGIQTDIPVYIKQQCQVNNKSSQTTSINPQNRNLHPRLSIKTAIRLLKKKQIDITIKGGRLLKYNDNRNRLKPFPAVEKRMERKILNKVIEYIHRHFDSEQISSRLRQLKNIEKVNLDLPQANLTSDSFGDCNDFDSGYASHSAILQEELLVNSATNNSSILYPNLCSVDETEIKKCDKLVYRSDNKNVDIDLTTCAIISTNRLNDLKSFNTGNTNDTYPVHDIWNETNNLKSLLNEMKTPEVLSPIMNKGVARTGKRSIQKEITTQHTKKRKLLQSEPSPLTTVQTFLNGTEAIVENCIITPKAETQSETKLNISPLKGQQSWSEDIQKLNSNRKIIATKPNNIEKKKSEVPYEVTKEYLFGDCTDLSDDESNVTVDISTPTSAKQKKRQFGNKKQVNNTMKIKLESQKEFKKLENIETNDHTYCMMSTMDEGQGMRVDCKKEYIDNESATYPVKEFNIISAPVEPSSKEKFTDVSLVVTNTSDKDQEDITNIFLQKNTIYGTEMKNTSMYKGSLPVEIEKKNDAQRTQPLKEEERNIHVLNEVEDDLTCHKVNNVLESKVIPQTFQNEVKETISSKKVMDLEHAMASEEQKNRNISWLAVKKRILSFIQFKENRDYLTRTAEMLNALDTNTLITYMLRLISNDSDVIEKGKSPFEPLLTKRQRALLGLLLHIEKEYNPKIIDTLLLKCENQILFSIRDIVALEPVVRFYTAICKMRRCKTRLRQLICNGLYFMDNLVIPLVFYALVSWIDVFKKYSESDCNPLIKVIIQVVHTKQCHEPEYQLGVLKNLLQVYYKFPNERFNENTLFSELLELYMCTFEEQYKLALLIICKNSDYAWTHKKLLLIKEIILLSKDEDIKKSLLKILEAISLTYKSNKSHHEKCLNVLKSVTNDHKSNLQPVINEVIKTSC